MIHPELDKAGLTEQIVSEKEFAEGLGRHVAA
jgi:hypothetical protein